MKPYRNFLGEYVDLSDPQLYKFLPNDHNQLRDRLLREIGYYYCYVNYWHGDVRHIYEDQIQRVEKLIQNFTQESQQHYSKSESDLLWWKEQIYLFEDEIENMC